MRTNALVNRPVQGSAFTAVDAQTKATPAVAAQTVHAPRQMAIPARSAPAPQNASGLGSFFGRTGKAVLGAMMGASMLLSSGCAVTAMEPLAPATAQSHVSRFVATDAGWVSASNLNGGPVPQSLGKILDQMARARHSDDGQFAYVLGDKGGKVVTSPWNSFEVGETVKLLKDLRDSGEVKSMDKRTVNAFLHEVYDVVGEVGPTGNAGWGFTAHKVADLKDLVLALEAQSIGKSG